MHRSPSGAARALTAALLLATAAAGCSKHSGSTAEFCTRVKQVPALETVLDRFSEADPGALADRIDKARTAYDDLADAAPKQIAEATDQVVGLVDAVLDAVEQHPTDPAKASAQLRKAVAARKGVEADRAEVAAFAQEHCDVRLDATLTDATAPTTAATTTTTEVDSVITAPPSGPATSTTAATTGG
ncbi:MAG TPA: hypothetical protein VNQ33_01290 [Acidimicrobiales bacterium]|nr:hypothetical protein [Acidimicrobiales bacterium]